ncbi:MAG: hypothetical protein RLZZ336_49 [Cyanobacteriota bacterium]|jgi:hypothetical protein
MPPLLQRLQRLLVAAALAVLMLGVGCGPLAAAPGICVGPVCGDGFTRSSTYPWLLRLRVSDQQGRHERLAIDCRSGALTPLEGPVERGYARAVAQRACRFTPEAAA